MSSRLNGMFGRIGTADKLEVHGPAAQKPVGCFEL